MRHSPREPRLFCRLSVACLAALLLVGGCGGPSKPASFELPIYFTCDTRGRLEPCGCFTGQFGGLTRLKTVLDKEAPPDALRVDVGDAIGGHEDYDLIEYKYLLRAFAELRYQALNIGHREARVAAAQLKEIAKQAPVPIISANLLDSSTGQRIFPAYTLVKRADGFKIGVIGVVDPRGLNDEIGEGLRVAGMEATLAQIIPELRGKADLLVLLAFTDEETLGKLAQQFFEVPVILGGKVRQPAQELKRENRSFVYFVTNESRALGILRVKWSRNAPLESAGNEILLLHDRIEQDPSFRAMVQEYRNEVRRTRLAVDDPAHAGSDAIPGVRTGATYVGTEACLKCHATAGAVWAKSGHAHAFATLVERKADADPKCIGCHTVGFGAASGYRREFGASKLVDTGCESCHGPGSLHVRRHEGDKSIEFSYRPLGPGDCQKCHYGEFSRPFKWDQFWPPVAHGAEPRQAALSGEGK